MTTPQAPQTASSGPELLRKLEDLCDEYLIKKSPVTLPSPAKDILVKFMPWLVILSVIMGVPAVFALFGLHSLGFGLGAYRTSYGVAGYLQIILLAIGLVFQILALPGIFSQTLSAWRFLFYAALLSLLGNILTVDIVGALLTIVIGLFLLFQVKERYH